MSLPNYLAKIKSAGVYRYVFDKTDIPESLRDSIRLVVGYSEKGPFNTPVYIDDSTDFIRTFGNISRRMERKGIFFHRMALQALKAGPIVCLNLKPFNADIENPEKATVYAFNASDVKTNNTIAYVVFVPVDDEGNVIQGTTNADGVLGYYNSDNDFVEGFDGCSHDFKMASTVDEAFAFIQTVNPEAQLADYPVVTPGSSEHTGYSSDCITRIVLKEQDMHAVKAQALVAAVQGTTGRNGEPGLTSIYNTNRFWKVDAERLHDIKAVDGNSMFEGNSVKDYIRIVHTGSEDDSCTVFIRPYVPVNWNIKISDWYSAEVTDEMPPYMESIKDHYLSEFFVEIYVFKGDLNKRDLYAETGTLGSYLNPTGRWQPFCKIDDNGNLYTNEMYVDAYGDAADALDAMSDVNTSNFVNRYAGICFPSFKDANGNFVDIASVFNRDYQEHKMLLAMNENLLDEAYDLDENENDIFDADETSPTLHNQPLGQQQVTASVNVDGTGYQNYLVYYNEVENHGIRNVYYINTEGTVDTATGSTDNNDNSGLGQSGTAGLYASPAIGNTGFSGGGGYTDNSGGVDTNTNTGANVQGGRIDGGTDASTLNGTWYVLQVDEVYNGMQLGQNNIGRYNGTPEGLSPAMTTGPIGNTMGSFVHALCSSVMGEHDINSDISSEVLNDGDTDYTDDIYNNNFIGFNPVNAKVRGLYIKGYKYNSIKRSEKGQTLQTKILKVLNYKGMREALTNNIDIDYKYIIDTFQTYPALAMKSQFTSIAKDKFNCLAILNFPPMIEILDKVGWKNYQGGFDMKAILRKGNISLPSEAQGASFAAFYTQLQMTDGSVKFTVPSAALVSNLFMTKRALRLPYYIVAGPNYGRITDSAVVGPDYNYARADLDVLEPYGVNAIIHIPRQGIVINGNQTAKQNPVTSLSKVHVRELVTFLQDELEEMLLGYQWELNTATLREMVRAKAEVILGLCQANGGIYDYRVTCDASNNTLEVINNSMLVLDVDIIAAKGTEKIVQTLTLHRIGASMG